MRVVESSRVFNAVELYSLTRNPESINMKTAAGSVICVNDWCIFTDVQEEGEKTLLSISAPDVNGERITYTTNSDTFIREFKYALDLCAECGENLIAVKVIAGKSKSDRDFITCALVDSQPFLENATS